MVPLAPEPDEKFGSKLPSAFKTAILLLGTEF